MGKWQRRYYEDYLYEDWHRAADTDPTVPWFLWWADWGWIDLETVEPYRWREVEPADQSNLHDWQIADITRLTILIKLGEPDLCSAAHRWVNGFTPCLEKTAPGKEFCHRHGGPSRTKALKELAIQRRILKQKAKEHAFWDDYANSFGVSDLLATQWK